MSVIRKMRRQKAVWWARIGALDLYGTPSFADPAEISCRWDDEVRQVLDSKGEVVTCRAVVYPDRPLGVGDKISPGELDSGVEIDSENTHEVIAVAANPNFKATEFLYTAYLR